MVSTFLTLALSCSFTADIQPPTTPDGLLAAMKADLPKLQEAERNTEFTDYQPAPPAEEFTVNFYESK